MRIFHSEFAHDYSAYAFGYQVHAELEPGEDAAEAYTRGFLPRSNDPSKTSWFYLARSVRVPLASFSLSSENRRVLKKFDGTLTVHPMSREELKESAPFKELFLTYFKTRHGETVMSAERLEGILNTVLPLRAIRYEDAQGIAGYVLEATEGPYLHYWYSAYRPDLAQSCLGLWMMTDALRRAQVEGRQHVYLGTAYGEKGRYKMNFTPLQYFDGEEWKEDMSTLKTLIANDARLVFKRD